MRQSASIALLLLLQICCNVYGDSPPPREVINFDFAWRFHLGNPNSTHACPPNAFPKNLSLVECSGLRRNDANTEESCMTACCLDPSCAIWQFDSSCTGHSCGCWIGQSDSCHDNSKWIGGGRQVPAVDVGPAARSFNDSAWELVDAPHDPIVAGTYTKDGPASHAYLPQSVIWYRKHFNLPEDWKGHSIWVYFDGVFRASSVFLNGHELLFHDSGYTGFSVRLDNASSVFFGDGAENENILAVFATAEGGSGWWYEGGGIYRHTYLISAGSVHFVADGLYGATNVTGTVKANDKNDPTKGMIVDKAMLNPIAEVVNDGAKATQFKVNFTLYDVDGEKVASGSTDSAMAKPNQTVLVHAEMSVLNIQLWTAARTYLYTLQFDVTSGSTPADSANVTIGFRRTHWDSNTGFYLNDMGFKWRGFCDHNDFTGVGVAVPDRVNLFRAQMVKAVGGNAWRMSHNPPTTPLLDILDRLGIVVWDENRQFGSNTEWVLNQRDMVRRDRNHPSVMVWSFCNEGGCAPVHGPALTAIGNVFKEASKEQDMYRPVTGNTRTGDTTYSLSAALDVTGFSHEGGQVFDTFHQKFPSRPSIASECCSCRTQRGEDVANKTKPNYGNFNGDCDKGQNDVQFDRKFVSGTLVWTLFDYYGEPSPYEWPQVSSAFGSIDLAGFAKASAFWYRSWWLYDPTNSSKASDSVWFPPRLPNPSSDPMSAQEEDRDGHLVHIVQSWEANVGGDKRTIQVYSNAPMVNLYVNGASQGVRNTTYRGWTQWDNVPYSSGNLTAVAMSSSGKALAQHTVETSGLAASIRLDVDVPSKVTGTGGALLLDGQDAGLVRATILDSKGRVVRSASHNVTFRVVSGPGRIIGVGNGDPMCHEPNTATWRSAYHGLARAVIQVTQHSIGPLRHQKRLMQIDRDGGKITKVLPLDDPAKPMADSIVVEATADEGLGSARATIPVSTDTADGVLSVAAKWMMG